jgi:bifunctional non-homologous end joining protein LigD
MIAGTFRPLGLQEIRVPFDDPEWLFEVKHDGFRSLAFIDGDACRLVSRNGNVYKRFADLRDAMPSDIVATNAILDGEIVVLDERGHSQFNALYRSKSAPIFAAFDLLCIDGADLRELPLEERKKRLRKTVRKNARRVLYVDHVKAHGRPLFAEVCKRDLEGVIAKPLISPYRNIRGKSPWIKIRNPAYSQTEGRGDQFNKRNA